MLELIHKNNIAPAEGIAEKIAGFEERYDSLVQTAAKKYGVPPSDYYRDGYNSTPPCGARQQPLRTEGSDTEGEDKPGSLAEELPTSGIFLRMPERNQPFRDR